MKVIYTTKSLTLRYSVTGEYLASYFPSFQFSFRLSKEGEKKQLPLSFLIQVRDVQEKVLRRANQLFIPLLYCQSETSFNEEQLLSDFFYKQSKSPNSDFVEYLPEEIESIGQDIFEWISKRAE